MPGSGASPHSDELLSESSSWAAGPYKDVQGGRGGWVHTMLEAFSSSQVGSDVRCFIC